MINKNTQKKKNKTSSFELVIDMKKSVEKFEDEIKKIVQNEIIKAQKPGGLLYNKL